MVILSVESKRFSVMKNESKRFYSRVRIICVHAHTLIYGNKNHYDHAGGL